jgi:hypothetical protein
MELRLIAKFSLECQKFLISEHSETKFLLCQEPTDNFDAVPEHAQRQINEFVFDTTNFAKRFNNLASYVDGNT